MISHCTRSGIWADNLALRAGATITSDTVAFIETLQAETDSFRSVSAMRDHPGPGIAPAMIAAAAIAVTVIATAMIAVTAIAVVAVRHKSV